MVNAQPIVADRDICPDPSAHTRSNSRLQDHASKAALHVTNPEKATEQDRRPILDSDGKLSSASAATSLKHAKPHELPSYPTVGIDTTSSGNTAANIATNNFKSFEHWKPGLSSSAGKAALLAHKDGGKVDLWTPSASDHGHTAAGAAMDKQSALSPRLDYGFTNEGRQRALKAATLSVTSRGRSGSTPTPPTQLYPDAHNAGHNALNAAAVAHKPVSRNSPLPTQMSSAANEAARLTHLNSSVNRNMFSEHPPIEVAAKQQKHHHALKGASLATQRQAQEAQTAEHPTNNATANARLYAGAGIQEQAQKLAQERLSKLDPDGVLAYREHYGYSKAQPRSRLSIRNRRARSSSGGTGRRRSKDDSDDDDATKAGRIRNQMSKFNEQVASVDSQKRKNDRNTLMAAAEKSVRQRMSTLDQQIFDETGKITPSVMEQWEAKARQRAAAESEKRLEHHGMVDLGGGRFMEQSEVEKIAASRMQPTLDEISATAEKQRARDEEVRLDQERRKEETAVQKQRDQDTKAEVKRAKQEEKEAQKSEKRMVKEEKRQGKAVKKEQDRKSEENDGGSTKTPKTSGENAESTGSFTAKATGSPAKPAPKKASSKLSKGERAAVEPSAEDPPGVPTNFDGKLSQGYQPAEGGDLHVSPEVSRNSEQRRESEQSSPGEVQTAMGPMFKRNPKRDNRVRSWLSKLKRSNRHAPRASSDPEPAATGSPAPPGEKAEADGGGLYSHYNEATGEEEEDVTGARAPNEEKSEEQEGLPKSRSISPPSVKSPSESGRGGAGASTVGDDEFEEAKDTFDEGALKAPPDLRVGSHRSESPNKRGSKFMEEL